MAAALQAEAIPEQAKAHDVKFCSRPRKSPGTNRKSDGELGAMVVEISSSDSHNDLLGELQACERKIRALIRLAEGWARNVPAGFTPP